MNRLPERTALGYIEEAEGWRTNIYNLPIVGASDGGAYTTLSPVVLSRGIIHAAGGMHGLVGLIAPRARTATPATWRAQLVAAVQRSAHLARDGSPKHTSASAAYKSHPSRDEDEGELDLLG